MGWFSKPKRIDILDFKLSRDELMRRSRILIIDDERPDLIDDLHATGYAVDYVPDITTQNINQVEKLKYDLIVLDFKSVGTSFGPDEGLSLLRHIKRVNPSVIVFAYTSKTLGSEHADFYRLVDGVLRKDAGIAESTEKIEQGLQQSRSVQNLWSSMLHLTNIQAGSKEDLEWQDLYVRSLTSKRKTATLKQKLLSAVTGEEAKQVGVILLEKLIEVGLRGITG